MKVGLLQCNWHQHNDIYPNLGSSKPYQPLELCYIGGLLKKNHEVTLLDAFLNDLSYIETAKKISVLNPDIIIINTANTYLFWRCCFSDIDVVVQTIKAIKTYCNKKIILIGPHGTVDPAWVIKKTKADFIIRGEPELTVKSLLDNNLNADEIQGIYTPTNKNGSCSVVTDLSLLNAPDYDLLEMEKYEYHSWSPFNFTNLKRGMLFEYSRGCPYQCEYCFKIGFRDKYRRKPVKQIINEIKACIVSYQIDYIFFVDEIFNVDDSEFRLFLLELQQLNISYGCQCRPDIMTTELVDLMKDSGCIYIEYGVESLNPEQRQKIKKNEKLVDVFRIIHYSKSQMKYVVYNLLDFTTLDLIRGGYHFNAGKGSDSLLNIGSTQNALETIVIFPKTPLCKEIMKNFNLRTFSWEDTSRFYWLMSRIKMLKKPKKKWFIMWTVLCLRIPFRILYRIIYLINKIAPIQMTFGRNLEKVEPK